VGNSVAVASDPLAGMLNAAAAFLHGKAFPRVGPPPLSGLLGLFRRAADKADPEQAAELTARDMIAKYPRRRYPAVVLGPPNGALVHLCAALGIPWLPYTDRPKLGLAYKLFLTRCLPPGGAILVVDCFGRRRRLGEQQVFQQASIDWSLEGELVEDLRAVSRSQDLALVRLGFSEPEDLSPLVADLYAWWYRRRSIIARRLLVTSYIVADPQWTFRVGAVPFWTDAVAESSAVGLERYLDARPPFDYINFALFQPGRAEAFPVLASPLWLALLARARRRGESLLDVDQAAIHSADPSRIARFEAAIKRIPARYPVPAPLPLEEFGGFLRYAGRYRVAVQPVDGRVRWFP
jgi:hypothetical protein